MTAGAGRLGALSALGLGAQPDDALDRVAGLVRKVLGVPVALVSLVDDERQYFPGQSGLPEPWAERRQTPLTHSFCQHVVLSGEPLALDDARLDERFADDLAIPELGVVAYAGVPLRSADGHVLGSLCAIGDEPRRWSDADVDLLTDLAALCASELRLRASAREAHDSLTRVGMLSEVSQALGSTLDADESAARLCRLAVPGLADWCVLGRLAESGRFEQVHARHTDPGQHDDVHALGLLLGDVLDSAAPVREVARTGEARRLAPGCADLLDGVADEGRQHLERLSPEHGLVVPVRSGGRTLAVLVLVRGQGRPEFSDDDLFDALDVGRRAGLALDNADLYRRQHDLAAALQRSLLTRLPEPDHLHVVARYRPAAAEAQVGGDWYDAFLQEDGATVLVVGDVTGHDVQAAAMMGQLRSVVRGIAYDRHETPAAVLSRVDAALPPLQIDTLATVVLARIEQVESDRRQGVRVMRWTSAGHPPPLLVHPDGRVEQLDRPPDLLLGLDPSIPRVDHEVELEPDSVVLLYTDGLVERRGSPLDHGLARLRQALAATCTLPLDELCDELLERLVPPDAEDDVALVAVRAYAEGSPRPVVAGRTHLPGQDG